MEIAKTREAELRGAVDALYEVFGNYPRPRQLAGYEPCDVPGAMVALRDVDKHWCGWYSRRAVTTQGTVFDLKHFLPRLFEVGVADWVTLIRPRINCRPHEISRESVDLPSLATKLVYADFHHWPDREKDAVRHLLRRGWRVRIALLDEEWEAFSSQAPFDDWAASFYCLFPDLSWVVGEWAAAARVPELKPRVLMYLSRALVEESDKLSAFVEPAQITPSQKANMVRLFGNKVLQRFLVEMERSADDDWVKLQLIDGLERARDYRAVWMDYRRGIKR